MPRPIFNRIVRCHGSKPSHQYTNLGVGKNEITVTPKAQAGRRGREEMFCSEGAAGGRGRESP